MTATDAVEATALAAGGPVQAGWVLSLPAEAIFAPATETCFDAELLAALRRPLAEVTASVTLCGISTRALALLWGGPLPEDTAALDRWADDGGPA